MIFNDRKHFKNKIMSYTNFTVSGLSTYVAEAKDTLLKNIAFGKGTRELISIQTGVKTKEHLHDLEIAAVFGDASDCGFTSAGTATLSERTIEVAALKVNMDICEKNLLGKYAEWMVKTAATGDKSLPFEEYVMEGIIASIDEQIETMIWLGDKTNQSSDPVKKWIDGFITIAAASVTGSTGVVGESIASGKTAYEGILQVYASIPEKVLKKGAMIFVSPAIFRAFMQDMVSLNYFHYNPGNEKLEDFPIPGTDVKVHNTPGLAGSLKILATYAANLYYGTDLENDEEKIDIWYSKDSQVFKVLAEWKSGAQIRYLDRCVLGTFAATPVATVGIAKGVSSLTPLADLAGAYDSTNKYIETHPNS